MYCKHCDNNIADGLIFCDVCGADLNADALAEFDNRAIDYDPTKNPGKIPGILSLTLGIASTILNFSCCVTYLPVMGNVLSLFSILTIPGGIAGLILGIIGRKKSKNCGFKNKKATAGIIISVAAIIIGITTIIVAILFMLGYLSIGMLGFAIFNQFQ